MGHLTLSFFGTFEAKLGHEPLTHFRSAKVQGLLIYLVLTADQTHARDGLATLFWPEEPEMMAKQNLRQSLFRLRKVLGDDNLEGEQPYLIITRSTVQFNTAASYSLDVANFLAALAAGDLQMATSTSPVQAVSLYPGDLLPSFSCDSLLFDEWLRQERERLHQLALDALFQRTTHLLTRGEFQQAERVARQQLILEPWREEAHRQLMQALFLAGQRTAALAQYETCCTLLAEELGIDPAPETEQLAAQIRAAVAKPVAQLKSDSALGREPLTIPFVGRKAEFQALTDAYQRVRQGGTFQVVSVLGKAGMGKTRLTQQFLNWVAAQGADVLHGRSFETSVGLSYQPLVQLLRPRLERENAPEDLLSDFWLSQLTRLLPELRDRYPDLPQPTQEEENARQHLFEAITRLGQTLAKRQPLILFIDDWHWADTASRDVLHYAALRWAESNLYFGGTPILLLLTLRQEVITADMQRWLTRLKQDVTATQIDLSALTQPETEELLQTVLAADNGAPDAQLPRLCRWLFAETNGQPLFLVETLKVLAADGLVRPRPDDTGGWQIDWAMLDQQALSSRALQGVQAIIRSWLNRITDSAREVLTAVSILEQEASFDHLCRVTELEELPLVTALDELLGKQLLLEADEAFATVKLDPVYSFSHHKISEIVYEEAGAARRRLLHRRAFAALQGTAVPAAELAHHALKAGIWSEGIRTSLAAGHDALSRMAVQVAVSHFETAQQVAEQRGWPETISDEGRQAFFTALGRAYELAEAWSKAKDTYEEMIAFAQKTGMASAECLGLNHLATVYHHGFQDYQQAIAILQQAKTIAERHDDRLGLANTESQLANVNGHAGKSQYSLYHSENALAIARELGQPHLLARCLNALAYGYAQTRQFERAVACAVEAQKLYTSINNLILAADSQRAAAFGLTFLGRPHESLLMLKESLAFSQRIENLWGEAECTSMLAFTHLEVGDYGQAIRMSKHAVEQMRQVGTPLMKMSTQSTWGIIQRTLMAWDAATKTLLLALAEGREKDITFGIDWVLSELCAVYAAAGDWEQAYEYAKQTAQSRQKEPMLSLSRTDWYGTEALLRGGDDDLARADVELLARLVGENKRYQLVLYRSKAVLAQWDGEVAQAVTHLEHALTLAQEMSLPGEEWPIWGELGRLYAAQGEDGKAKQAYGEAGVIIRRLAETIDDEGVREGWRTAVSTHTILQQGKRA